MRATALLLTAALAVPAFAQEAPAGEVAPPPPLPEDLPLEEGMEPEVRIIQRGEEVIEEYRVNGRIVMVKITPTAGVPYYLIDTDGDGSLETFRNDLDNPPVVQWKLFQW